jgi:hypothetical protein
MRQERLRTEQERRAGRKTKADRATDLEKIKSIEWLFPNCAKVLRKHGLRSP